MIDTTKKFDYLYRMPFGPVGFYSLGILLSIFYFEYQMALSNRTQRDRYSYKLLNFFQKSRKYCIISQISGLALLFFVIFIRYSCYAFNNDPMTMTMGRWPVGLDAIFNSLAPYLFIFAFVLIFIPIFVGKLSIIRDIFTSAIFRPISRINFSVSQIQGLMLLLIYYS
jgi:hypothetical protein